MDLYEEKELVISSDEYSDDDDDDDALMNDAVRAQDHNIRPNNEKEKRPEWINDRKQKELSSLIRRNKISVIYKNKSIKWLNNKRQRDRYKERIHLNAKKSITGQITPTTVGVTTETLKQNPNYISRDPNYDTMHIQDIVSIEDDNTDVIFNKSNNKEITEEKKVVQKISSSNTLNYDTEVTNIHPEKDADTKSIIREGNNIEPLKKFTAYIEKAKEVAGKRRRSSSPINLNETDAKHCDKKTRNVSSEFYKSINDMFPNFDKIATNHVDSIASSSLAVVEEKMKNLSNEIDTLNEILQSKEMEWNRLLHLKLVKEEIHSRLIKKWQVLQLKESFSKKQGPNILLELKEMEYYLSEKKPTSETNHSSSVTIQKLIENRANMNADDLKREKNNTSRLHSLLVSQNMLNAAESLESTADISNGEKTNMGLKMKHFEIYKNLYGGNHVLNRGRQGEVRDVKSLIEDFRQKNPELPRVGKRIKSAESNTHQQGYDMPLLEKTSSCAPYFTKDHQSDFYALQNSVDEISITPIVRSKTLSSNHDIDFVNAINNHCNVRLEDNFLKNQVKRDIDRKCPENVQYPLCQECKSKESRFVCAGCENQWYCSKKCQISAWDKHSEICTE